ncbi:MAG: zinc ribbon domain-containing protein [Dehalococcoidia bacterium]|jgi:putative FmdB family regulatory protein|nr:zinc ribbon domain-containing protein [Dehalococcoidia bacterium]
MPLYEYECEKCGRRTEVRQAVGQNGEQVVCPSCGTVGLRRIFSSFFCTGSDGATLPGGGSSCSTCSSGNCASCGM